MFCEISKSEFDEIYEIMEESFPTIELRLKEVQKSLLDLEIYSIYGIKNEINSDKKYKGFIAIWEIDKFMYIDHFAISKNFRGDGIGGKVLDDLIEWKNKAVVLEVELPDGEVEKKRIQFYEKHGFYFNDYEYMQPPMRPNQELYPLRLMTYPYKLDENEFQYYKSKLYEIVYNYREG